MTTLRTLIAVMLLAVAATPAHTQIGVYRNYNPWTGRSMQTTVVRNPWNGVVTRQTNLFNPWTGARSTRVAGYNPWTGRSFRAGAAYNPWTNRGGQYFYRR